MKPDDFHYARTCLLCLENTTWGKVLPPDYLKTVRTFAQARDLSLHVDGARIFNASIAQGVPASEIAEGFNSVSVCLSKGLGTPVGSVLVSSSEFINEARRWRKMVGGGMRQSGFLATARIYALENHVTRLADDHENAKVLAEGLAAITTLKVDPVQTNMVFFDSSEGLVRNLAESLLERQILISGYTGSKVRLVTHLGITAEDIDRVFKAFRDALASVPCQTSDA